MNEHNKQAEDFLKKTNTTFKAEFIKYDLHFIDEKEKRDIYKITLTRGERKFSFEFGQSLFCSGKFINREDNLKYYERRGVCYKNKDFEEPSPYDVLACLNCYEIEEFKDWCSEFGYNDDSIKSNKIYKKVVEEYNNVKMLWSDEEIKLLQEIN